MNLYLIYQNTREEFETYGSAVVAAMDEKEAQNIHPCGYKGKRRGWVNPKYVIVDLIGKAVDGTERGVICANYRS